LRRFLRGHVRGAHHPDRRGGLARAEPGLVEQPDARRFRPVEPRQLCWTQLDHALARARGIANESRDVDALTGRRERTKPLDPLLQQDAGAVEVPTTEVMESNADLENAVVEIADRCAGAAPQRLQRLVLLEVLAMLELLDRMEQLLRRRFITASAERFLDETAGHSFRRASPLALAASGFRHRRRR